MRRQDFFYELPDELIARYPTEQRTGSRLLCLDGNNGDIQHRQFMDVLALVQPGDLMVFNDTRVIPARLFGQKASGGKVEVLVERVMEQQQVLAHVRSSRSPRAGTELLLEGGVTVEVIGRHENLFILQFPQGKSVVELLEQVGHMPLPPYMEREDQVADRERYQTVYNQKPGAAAAPTAGLHFDESMLKQLAQSGVEAGFVTLHVGAGTFQPVKVDNIHQHVMHAEYIEVSESLCQQVKATRARGGRVIAVGTTSVRCLETASQTGEIQPFIGDTDIFIYPGYDYKSVDALITNFHLPESTLLMLVSAFAGYHHTMNAYKSAIEEKYRFFSYGDAMWIERNSNNQDMPPSLT